MHSKALRGDSSLSGAAKQTALDTSGPQRGHWPAARPQAFTDQWLSYNAILLHLYKGVIIAPFPAAVRIPAQGKDRCAKWEG